MLRLHMAQVTRCFWPRPVFSGSAFEWSLHCCCMCQNENKTQANPVAQTAIDLQSQGAVLDTSSGRTALWGTLGSSASTLLVPTSHCIVLQRLMVEVYTAQEAPLNNCMRQPRKQLQATLKNLPSSSVTQCIRSWCSLAPGPSMLNTQVRNANFVQFASQPQQNFVLACCTAIKLTISLLVQE
jgi:hypothetical protein